MSTPTLIGTEISEGLTVSGPVGLGFPPPQGRYARVAYAGATPDVETATLLLVRPDSTVTAFVGKVEYGQGIRSGFAIATAEELRVPLAAVEVVLGDTARTPWDMGTFGSQSTMRVGGQIRQAAATARQALLELASVRLDLPADALDCRDGNVFSRSDPGRSVSYGELVAGRRLDRGLDSHIALTSPAEFTVMGQPLPRVDAVDRVTGRTQYSQDVLVPGMLYAAVLRPPSYGARLVGVTTAVAENLPGVVQVAQDGDLVAVLAENDEQAALALRFVPAEWEEDPNQPSHLDMPNLLLETAREPYVTQDVGSLDGAFSPAESIVESMYYVPYVSTVPMEPKAAVAAWEDGRLTVWAGSQLPFTLRAELAKTLEVEEALIRVITCDIGGGFGNKSFYPVAQEAARLARLAGRPVRVAYSRTDEIRFGVFRPAGLWQFRSGVQPDGTVVAQECNATHAGITAYIGRRGSDSPYAIPNMKVTVSCAESPLRTGGYRSLGSATNHFARECHMDEIAASLHMDPIAFRLKNLDNPRFGNVIEHAAAQFGWTPGSAPTSKGQGFAIAFDAESYAATCVEIALAGSEIVVKRVVVAADCGLVVNPTGVLNQIEGGVIQGLGTALFEAVEFQSGMLLNSSFARYRVPRSTDAPKIEVSLVGDPQNPSAGAGEIGIVAIAAAIANAVFDLRGQRVYELPLNRQIR